MERTPHLGKLIASGVLVVSAVGFAASLYAQTEIGRLNEKLAADAQPLPNLVAVLADRGLDGTLDRDAGRVATLVATDTNSDLDDVGV